MESGRFGFNTTQQQQNELQPKHFTFAPMMPSPAETPWNPDLLPWAVNAKKMENAGNVMQFCAQNNLFRDIDHRAQFHQKRKSDFLPPQPAKQFISEEKMTAHFNGLHISSDYVQKSNSSSSWPHEHTSKCANSSTNLAYHDYQVAAKELEEKLKRAERITVCEEIKKFSYEQNKSAFLPQALFNAVEKPCTALVLWQRPPILELLQTSENKNSVDKNIGDSFHETDDEIVNTVINTGVDGMDTDF